MKLKPLTRFFFRFFPLPIMAEGADTLTQEFDDETLQGNGASEVLECIWSAHGSCDPSFDFL